MAEYTLPQVAAMLGIHRTTLKRMEDRGVVPKARWLPPPQHGRTYNAREVAHIKDVLARMAREQSASKDRVLAEPTERGSLEDLQRELAALEGTDA